MNQKMEAKLQGNLGERSQGEAVRRSSRRGPLLSSVGVALRPKQRTCLPALGEVCLLRLVQEKSCRRSHGHRRAVCRVEHAITSDTRLDHITGEVPPCPAKTQVKEGYKRATKSQPYARATVTVSCRHRPQGYQQRQSSPLNQDERQNHKQPVRAPVTRIVSPWIAVTPWPAGTSSRQPHGALRNIPTGTAAAQDRPSTTFQETHETVRSS